MSETAPPARRGVLDRILDAVEWLGNRLPHAAILFFLFALSVVVASWVLARAGVTAVHPGTGEAITVVNLVSADGLRRIVTGVVTNFTGFVPLGTVLVAMLGVGVAEHSGLIGAALRGIVLAAPRRLITLVVVLSGILSNAASDIGYVVLIPMGAVIFQACGRHPLAGLAAAFAGVSGGFSANLVLGTIDPMLAGITQEAARIVDPAYEVSPAANYYFMIVSTFLLAALGALVTERVVEPRLGRWEGQASDGELAPLTAREKRGLLAAGAVTLVLLALTAWAVVPAGAPLRDPATGGLLHSPFLNGIVAIMLVLFLLPGLAYGRVAGTVRGGRDLVDAMTKSMNTMGSYIVLVFFAAQFVAYFGWTRIGLVTAVAGAEALRDLGLGGVPLMLGFVLVSAAVNLVMGSASAKWALMAPIFVPMFMLLGYAPELTQAAYRVGDSVSNVLTPMMSFFALIVAFAQRYRPDLGLGTLIATMLPYSVAFLVGWMLLLVAWMGLGLPLGPGAALYLEPAGG